MTVFGVVSLAVSLLWTAGLVLMLIDLNRKVQVLGDFVRTQLQVNERLRTTMQELVNVELRRHGVTPKPQVPAGVDERGIVS